MQSASQQDESNQKPIVGGRRHGSAGKPWLMVCAAVIAVVAAVGLFKLVQHQRIISKASAAPAQVVITSEGFSPVTIKVKRGVAVTWMNRGGGMHALLSDDESAGLDSEESLNVGDSFSHAFDKAGTFTYHDPLNPSKVKGTVIVE